MGASRHDFTGDERCEIGATFAKQFTLCVGLTEAEKYAISTGTVTAAQQASIDSKTRNLTGYTARMNVSAAIGGAPVLTLTTSNGGLTLGGTAGTINIDISATQTAALAPALYYYDLELLSGAVVERRFQGRFEADPRAST